MSSTTDIEMVYSPDGSDALTSSDLLKTTNGDLLKMLLEIKKEVSTIKANQQQLKLYGCLTGYQTTIYGWFILAIFVMTIFVLARVSYLHSSYCCDKNVCKWR